MAQLVTASQREILERIDRGDGLRAVKSDPVQRYRSFVYKDGTIAHTLSMNVLMENGMIEIPLDPTGQYENREFVLTALGAQALSLSREYSEWVPKGPTVREQPPVDSAARQDTRTEIEE